MFAALRRLVVSRSRVLLTIGSILLGLFVAGAAFAYWRYSDGHEAAAREEDADVHSHKPVAEAPEEGLPSEVSLPESAWKVAGLRMADATTKPEASFLDITGKVKLNDDRVAHLFPMVGGRIEETYVKFGDRVKKGDPLVLIHSQAVGDAKLALYEHRLARESAQIKNEWDQKVAKNLTDLIAEVRRGAPLDELDLQFRTRPMGRYRETLLSAYAGAYKSRADFERLSSLDAGTIAGKQLLAAEVIYEVDQVSLQATLEQIEQEARYEAQLSEQAFRQAESQVAVDAARLAILGYEPSDVESIDPSALGETLSHYVLKAPFDGAVVSKDAALMEQVTPDREILRLADLSTVWISMDVFEKHLSFLDNWRGRDVSVRTEVWGEREFPAQIFAAGDVVDESTRTVSMVASAENADGSLRPGMFVTVRTENRSGNEAVTIPRSAVLEHEGRPFVFVHLAGDRFARRDVTIRSTTEKEAVIEEGLAAGEPVVVEGGFALKSRALASLLEE
jgi:cobalt-zinc-cadmium efflux system membrane fusion protein